MNIFPGSTDLIARYQKKVKDEGLKTDELGYYLVPWAYAYLDVLGQAVNAVGKIDHEALAKHLHETEFETVVGRVKFGPNGEWTEGRTVAVQYQGIKNNDLAQFAKPGTRRIIFPASINKVKTVGMQ